ncbi:N-acetylmuramic acid 6-phosphate etherase [Friedmanniella endophytica]|uniref:N-acetylmuramic acid 6-phosphate etherase n=2 Tax=Microlunatus kandeliicorticis TaxID=1759536 RepID=A0A7W3P756_9ACTN|nr:N-acetylmuramic acid 6-phosphate etherase [Microlunatus kandeliicorticis]
MTVGEIVAAMNAADFDVPRAIEAALPQISRAIEAAEPRFCAGGRLIYVGSGTSGRLGVLDASECPPTFHTDPSRVVGIIAGGPTALTTAVEGAEDDAEQGALDLAALRPGRADTVVGLAASGRTPYVIGALEEARRSGALTVGISANVDTAVSAAADHAIEIDTGPEVLAGSTRLKAGTAQKQVLNMISTALMVRAGRTYGNLMVSMNPSNTKLRRRAVELVAKIAEVDPVVAVGALEQSGYDIKVASVMLIQHETAAAARNRLARADGRLAVAIGRPSSEHPGLHRV